MISGASRFKETQRQEKGIQNVNKKQSLHRPNPEPGQELVRARLVQVLRATS